VFWRHSHVWLNGNGVKDSQREWCSIRIHVGGLISALSGAVSLLGESGFGYAFWTDWKVRTQWCIHVFRICFVDSAQGRQKSRRPTFVVVFNRPKSLFSLSLSLSLFLSLQRESQVTAEWRNEREDHYRKQRQFLFATVTKQWQRKHRNARAGRMSWVVPRDVYQRNAVAVLALPYVVPSNKYC